MGIIDKRRFVAGGGVKRIGKNVFGTLHSRDSKSGESGGSGFGKLVFGVVASNGYNTKGMSFDEAFEIFENLGGKKNWAMAKFENKDDEITGIEIQGDSADDSIDKYRETEKIVHIKDLRENTSRNIAVKTKGKNADVQRLRDLSNQIADSEMEAFNKGVDSIRSIQIKSQVGSCTLFGDIIMESTPSELDVEMGFETAVSVFTHETGHALDHEMRISERQDVINSAKTGCNELLNAIYKKGGGYGEVNFENLSRNSIATILKGFNTLRDEMMGEKECIDLKWSSDFGYITKPILSYRFNNKTKQQFIDSEIEMSIKEKVYIFGKKESEARDEAIKELGSRYDEAMDDYNKKLKAYQEAESSGKNSKALQEYENYEKQRDEWFKKKNIVLLKMANLTDMVGIASKGQLRVQDWGYYGHGVRYGSDNPFKQSIGRSVQSECWAEYYQSRIMGNKDKLDLLNKYCPTMAKKFDEIYNEINKGE